MTPNTEHHYSIHDRPEVHRRLTQAAVSLALARSAGAITIASPMARDIAAKAIRAADKKYARHMGGGVDRKYMPHQGAKECARRRRQHFPTGTWSGRHFPATGQ